MQGIKIDAGYISGTILGEPDKPLSVFRGIPYAAPPVGDLRWKPPQPVAGWSGIRECTAFSARAPQPAISRGPALTIDLPIGEDCLYLNVISPAQKASDKLPVMVYMHGGALSGGTGNDPLINALRLPSQGVVLVNVNMRLGPIGLLAHPLLSRESPKGVSGNYLFLDMLAALNWVQTNIAAFGGDPTNVTIFGESGGSVKVVVLMASPLGKGLFHRAIGESGAPTVDFFLGIPLREAEAVGQQVFARLGVDQDKDPLAAARALPWEKIIDAGQALAAETKTAFGPWDSAVDGWFLPDTPANLFKSGKQNVVPFIMGANLGELTGPGIILMPQVIPAYVDLFISAAKVGGKGYGYIFDHVPSGWKKNGVVASHGLELHYVFGDWDPPGGVWPMGFNLAKASGARSADPGLGDTDRKISEVMMRLWANFAKTGNPSLKGVVDWPAYQKAADQYLYITESMEIKSGFSRIAQK